MTSHNPRIIVVTPPPVEERRLLDSSRAFGYTNLTRASKVTKTYADAAREVAGKGGFVVCDLWKAMMEKAGWREGEGGEVGEVLPGCMEREENEVLRALLSDGKLSKARCCKFNAYSG